MARYDWEKFTDNDKRACRDARATLILAPREMSEARIAQLLRELLPKGNVIFGVAAEPFVAGFEGQPQFRMLPNGAVAAFEEKVSHAQSVRALHSIRYPQSVTDDVIRAVRPARVIVVRGSYLYTFHRSSTFKLLNRRGIPFELVSPFADEVEASVYEARVAPLLPVIEAKDGDVSMVFAAVNTIAKRSYDYSFQTGAVLARALPDGTLTIVDAACNEVVPYQTYALLHGNVREEHESALHDGAHYDTIHAEMNLLARAAMRGDPLGGAHLFINLLPCPACARTLCKTGIAEVVYRTSHWGGYALELFEACGIKTRHIEEVPSIMK